METNFNLNKYFDKIYCLCKPSNYTRWNSYKEIFSYYNLDVKLIPAEDLSSRVVNNVHQSLSSRGLLENFVDLSFIANSLSYTTFINHAIDNKFNKILILKENVIPNKNYKFETISIKNNWDFLIIKNGNNIIGYGIISEYFIELLTIIKKFKQNFDQIIQYNFNDKAKDIINLNSLFLYNEMFLNENNIPFESISNKKIYFLLYPLYDNLFIKEALQNNFFIYNQFDKNNWEIDYNQLKKDLYKPLFNNNIVVCIGNSFHLNINQLTSIFKNLNFIIINEKLENINSIDNLVYYPTKNTIINFFSIFKNKNVTFNDNFEKLYFYFFYDLINNNLKNKNNIIYIDSKNLLDLTWKIK